MSSIILKGESYQLVGICMEIHRELGMGFKEIVYKDALEYEFKSKKINFIREKEFKIQYKDIILPHRYYADFIIHDSIILEVKASYMIVNNFVTQTINYLKASGLQLGIIANFGKKSFTLKRVVF
jgi:GxxExxY protein